MQKTETIQSGFYPHIGCYVRGPSNPWGLRARFIALPTGQVQVRFIPQKAQAGYDGIAHSSGYGAGSPTGNDPRY